MGTPAEVLQAFWQELRGRPRVTIDHPDLPEALKDIAAGAVQTIWQAANEAATGELATLRAEARHAASVAEAERDAARTETAAAREEVAATSAQLAEARQTHDAVHAELAAERQAHAATQARLETGRAELDAAGRQLAELRTQFSTELARAREQVTLAQERAEAALARQLRNGPPSTVIDGLVESVCSSVYTWVKIRRRLPALAGRDCAQFSVVETARQTKHRLPRCEP